MNVDMYGLLFGKLKSSCLPQLLRIELLADRYILLGFSSLNIRLSVREWVTRYQMFGGKSGTV